VHSLGVCIDLGTRLASDSRPLTFDFTKAAGEKNRPPTKSRGTPKSLPLENYTNVQQNV
jgi:hypothetical protein